MIKFKKRKKVITFTVKEMVGKGIMSIDFDVPVYEESGEDVFHHEHLTAFFNRLDIPLQSVEAILANVGNSDGAYDLNPKLLILPKEDADILFGVLDGVKNIQELCRVDFEKQSAPWLEHTLCSAVYHPDIMSADEVQRAFEAGESDRYREKLIILSREKDCPWCSLQRFNTVFGFIPKRTNSDIYVCKAVECSEGE